jgi:hypothetical protein
MDVIVAAEQEPGRRGRVQVQVVAADPVDGPRVQQVLAGALGQAQIGQQPEQEQRRQHRQREQEERLADVGDLADERQGNHGAGDSG